MKKKAAKNKQNQLHEQAISIAADIFNLTNQFTHDSITSKFFMPDELSKSFYIAAGGFSSVVYDPQLDIKKIQKLPILSFFLVLITYGFQIYIKERSIRTNSAPYRIPTDVKLIEKASISILKKADNGDLISSPLSDEIIAVTVKQIHKTILLTDFYINDHTLDEKKLSAYMVLALYYGYNMATYLLHVKN